MADDTENQNRDQDLSLSDDLVSSKTEQTQEIAQALINNYAEVAPLTATPIKGAGLGGRDLKLYDDWLANAHAYFLDASNHDLTLSLASEWILDNYYVIRQALLQIGEDLPAGYYHQLPKLVQGSFQGLPRIFAITRAVLYSQEYALNSINLQTILVQVQDQLPLTMGELWAVPIFLRYSLIEALAQTLLGIIHPKTIPELPAYPHQFAGASDTSMGSQTAPDDSVASGLVANIVLSFRTITEQNWKDFFESVSRLDQTLRLDPAGIYPLMDFTTRNLYREKIEKLALSTGRDENELAKLTIDLARQSGGGEGEPSNSTLSSNRFEKVLEHPLTHIGEYLIGNSQAVLEEKIGYHPDSKMKFKQWVLRHSNTIYLSSIFILGFVILALISLEVRMHGVIPTNSLWRLVLTVILGITLLVPILTVSSSVINWLVTLKIKPRILPKMRFRDEIPNPFQTLVVIPALISNHEDVNSLTRQLEMHFLHNPEPGLLFALLTDFPDAESETLPEDEPLLKYAAAAIEKLNTKYRRSISPDHSSNDDSTVEVFEVESIQNDESYARPAIEDVQVFYLLHRKRLWNPSEGRWMGWERKRGKLHELNQLLRGGKNLSFSNITGNTKKSEALQGVRFVITLDADTVLPHGAARRLVGTLAHPLNHARFSDSNGKVSSGYTVLQPRMEIHPRSANHSWFTRIFAGDTGLDLYTRAVSDAYQDLFGEGSYVGKGIYDVDAFERSVNHHIPENKVLSHDLLEGIMGRAGLVTDITMVEDYPPNYFVNVKRQQRWIRGDWQLLPWLLRPAIFGVNFSAIDQWKMLDNLLRSLLSPALLLIFFLGLLAMPSLARLWIAILLLSLGIPLLTSMVRGTLKTIGGKNIAASFHPLRWDIFRWLLAITFIPYEAYNSLDAIFTTLYRMLVSHHDLLQWTTAAQTARVFGLETHRNEAWLKMSLSTLVALILGGGIQIVHSSQSRGVAPALIVAAPLLLLWMFSPMIAQWVDRPIVYRKAPLSDEQADLFRQVARRTWGFFERFVGPEDHWLPPDHFQESPVGIIAHQTSPSNIGLLLTSTLAAYDMGYLDQLGLATRLSTTIGTIDQMERFRGHFFNWYDTLTLQPLTPRYVSTVDSGNLAASLIITAQAAKSMPSTFIFRWELWQGYLDTLSNLTEVLTEMRKPEFDRQVEEIDDRIFGMRDRILSVRTNPRQWYSIFQVVSGSFWQDLSTRLGELVKVGSSAFTLESLRKLEEVAGQVDRHHQAIQRTLGELVPWIILLETPPVLFNESPYLEVLNELRTNLPYNPILGQINTAIKVGLSHTTALRDLLHRKSALTGGVSKPGDEAADWNAQAKIAEGWLDAFDRALAQARTNSNALINTYAQLAAHAEQFVDEMDFKFLYHPERRVFHIGYNLDAGLLDNNHYDLLASEARIASIIALAKGEIPHSHWLQLNRPLTRVEGEYVLLSWSATMFEYLMPPLFLRSYPGTLLSDSTQGAVLHQIAYGKSKGVPWGISEAGFFRFDANRNYQYRAFGVPGLGFKRGLGDDLVIAPYASLMAIGYNAPAVAKNLVSLMEKNCFGLYGMYESIDFTANRLLAGDTAEVVYEYMAHHQGMIMMALVNYFHHDVMVRRMHSDPRIQSVELLLQEQIPQAPPVQNPFTGEVKGIQRLVTAPVEVNPWNVPVQTAIPQMNLLSNGDYGVLISNMGSGYSTWRGIDLTRWQADPVLDPWGNWIYIQEMKAKRGGKSTVERTWSTGHQPIPGEPSNMQVTYFAHMAVYRRTENGISSTMEVTVSPDDPVEIRRVHLLNMTNHSSRLRLTSYGEVILTQQAGDTRHPAFNKLFIESEFIPEYNLQIFTRRLRSKNEKPVFLGHMLALESIEGTNPGRLDARHESDRSRFIGRGRSLRDPAALTNELYLTGTTGATLDPIFSLGQEVEVGPHATSELAYLTFVGESREAVLALAARYSLWPLIDRTFRQADISAQAWLGKQNFDTQTLKNTLQVLSVLQYPFKIVRASPETIASNHLGQSGLWRFGISGDYPIILVEIDDAKQVDLVREVLGVQEFLRNRRFMTDVVLLNKQHTEYGAELNGILYRTVTRLNCEDWLNQRGGIFILYADQINPEEAALLQTAGRFIFKGDHGTLNDQMPEYPFQVHHLPEFTPTRPGEIFETLGGGDSLPSIEQLQFFNGYGGFTQDGREYVIDLPQDKNTPAPWINVIGYPNFGFMVSENGSQSTWAVNSGENRLTPWSNDPVSDPTGEALYLRDEETGEVWSPAPLPAGDDQPYRVTHGAGYSIFDHFSNGLRQRMTLFASPEDPVKIIHLSVENTWNHPRRVTATQYVEWVLGSTHAASASFIIPEYDAAEACLLATNPYNAEFGQRAAFLIASKSLHGLTADRTEFLGRAGDPACPAALHRIGLETRLSPGEDPCAALQLHLDLLPGAKEEIYFVLGQGSNKEEALNLARKYHDPTYVGAALERTHAFWDHLLGTVQVHTPQPATDLILNRWMLYQSLSCRIWGRSAFYQPSGAFGFRDQLQDVLALLTIDPTISRGQILNAAERQFTQGDVLHWWHPPSRRGVRTRISDDLLWLAYVTAQYIETTGDAGILDEKIPFLDAPPLNQDETERYDEYPLTKEVYSLLEHCERAIEKGATRGAHGLPLIGTGDWNDGLNRVGAEGRGESVWLAWFLCDVLERFVKISEQRGDVEKARHYRKLSKEYAAAVERNAWDGAWYRRAYYDDGSPLGSRQDSEAQIDALPQSWSVLSGAGDPGHSRQAMQSVLEHLVLPQDRLSLLFSPPFDKTERDPGYIKGYFPGIRENGGQYSHAAVWSAWAFACMGEGKQAGELFDMLNPVLHSSSNEMADEYRVEPYVMSADIYSQPPYLRRGGWTWYTGSAAWMYRLGVEELLGFHKTGNTLRIEPVIPPAWDGFEMDYQFGTARYQIKVVNPDHVAQHVKVVKLDGEIMQDHLIALTEDVNSHTVEVIMGEEST